MRTPNPCTTSHTGVLCDDLWEQFEIFLVSCLDFCLISSRAENRVPKQICTQHKEFRRKCGSCFESEAKLPSPINCPSREPRIGREREREREEKRDAALSNGLLDQSKASTGSECAWIVFGLACPEMRETEAARRAGMMRAYLSALGKYVAVGFTVRYL